jgi:uncharacterized protein (TIGR00297 family)
VHILVGFEWVILYRFFGGGIHFLAVCLLFLVILTFSHRKKLLPMIESDSDNSLGTVYYAIAMSIMAIVTLFIPDMIIPFGIGVFCTSLGDGFAGLMGQLMSSPRNSKIYGNKTIYGTIFNFIICFIVSGVINSKFSLGLLTWHLISVAIFATSLELFTGRGLDNITVTLGASFLTYFFIHFEGAENYIIPILLTPPMIAFAYKKQALTLGGIISAIIVDIIISLTLGNFGFVILLTFFIGGLITDKIKKCKKNKGRRENMRLGEPRNYRQVLANSIISAVCSTLFFITKNRIFLITFVASLAESFADTTASGIGSLSDRAYDVFRLRKCRAGLSGGMSILGTFSALISTFIINIIAAPFIKIEFAEGLIIIIAAFSGMVFDSLLGSLLQIKFKCSACGEIVEQPTHCNGQAIKHSGISFVDNDLVNFLSTVFATVLAAILYII